MSCTDFQELAGLLPPLLLLLKMILHLVQNSDEASSNMGAVEVDGPHLPHSSIKAFCLAARRLIAYFRLTSKYLMICLGFNKAQRAGRLQISTCCIPVFSLLQIPNGKICIANQFPLLLLTSGPPSLIHSNDKDRPRIIYRIANV
ncbi:hypothetical protein L7F22_008553 [Adiantum nelumboides]|nr:hypothetical protein [Adiantum nelumboides]